MSRSERLFAALCLTATIVPIVVVVGLLAAVLGQGLPALLDLLSSSDASTSRTELVTGLLGSIHLAAVTTTVAVPVGVATAIYLEEYRTSEAVARWVEFAVDHLAGLPPILYGLVGLELFVRTIGLGRSLWAGGLSLALLILPLVVIHTRDALRWVPASVREAAIALGSTRWQVVRGVILPMAWPGMVVAWIQSLSRAVAEAAPLVVLGGALAVSFMPDEHPSPINVLPVQIFEWMVRTEGDFAVGAAAGIVVLLLLLFVMNLAAVLLRARTIRMAP